MTSVDELEQTYRRIYQRLAVAMFVAYGIVVVVALAVLLKDPVAVFSGKDGARPAASPVAATQSAGRVPTR
jgi:hypothetical protein